MTPEQEKQVIVALNQIAYSLEFLTRQAQVWAIKYGLPAATPPDAKNYPGLKQN